MSIEITFNAAGTMDRVAHHAKGEPVKAAGFPSLRDDAEPFVTLTVGATILFLTPDQARTAGDALYAAADKAEPDRVGRFEILPAGAL